MTHSHTAVCLVSIKTIITLIRTDPGSTLGRAGLGSMWRSDPGLDHELKAFLISASFQTVDNLQETVEGKRRKPRDHFWIPRMEIQWQWVVFGCTWRFQILFSQIFLRFCWYGQYDTETRTRASSTAETRASGSDMLTGVPNMLENQDCTLHVLLSIFLLFLLKTSVPGTGFWQQVESLVSPLPMHVMGP